MRDVAALAGVSLKTVSRVVNEEGGVSVDVRARVQRAIGQLGYQHNLAASNLRRSDARTGTVSEVFMGAGSAPRRIAAAPDGSLWVALNGNGKLAKIEPEARRIAAEYAMPAGENGNPYAVTVAGDGKVWANEIRTDTVALFDPKTEKFRVFQLPSKDVGIRKMVVDGQGRLWYMGSHNGRLGVIE